MFLLNLCKFFDIHKNLYALTTCSPKTYLPSFGFNMDIFTSFLSCGIEISFQVRATKKFLWIIGCFPPKKENSFECVNVKNFFPYCECKFQNVWSQMYRWTKCYALEAFDQVLLRSKRSWTAVLFIHLWVYKFRSLSVTDTTKQMTELSAWISYNQFWD